MGSLTFMQTITFGDDTCDACPMRQFSLNTGESRCSLFGAILKGDGKPERCRQCRETEASTNGEAPPC